MAKSIDITGQRFGRLVARDKVAKISSHQRWLCDCDCGGERKSTYSALVHGRTKSCGCLHRETSAKNCRARSTHGMRHTPEYKAWQMAKDRCRNPRNQVYDRYGGRGIYFDPAWDTFEAFIADMGRRPGGTPRYTLERMDNDGPYAAWNCKWATYKDQLANRRPYRKKA